MDYLTVLSTLRVELFVGHPSFSPLVNLAPITMSLLALTRDDTYCAFYLLDCLMENIGAQRPSYASSTAASTESRAIMQAAEITVWEEICRAKSFARSLGCFFEAHDRVTDLELCALAASHGIGLAQSPTHESCTSPKHSHSHAHSYNDKQDHMLHPRHDEDPVCAHSLHHASAVAPLLV